MRPAEKIRATIAAADLKFDEFSALAGITRQRLNYYLKPNVFLADYEGGIRCIDVSKKLWKLCEDNKLPLSKELSGDAKMLVLKKLLRGDTLDLPTN